MGQGAQLQAGTADAFKALQGVQEISENAKGLIETSDGKLAGTPLLVTAVNFGASNGKSDGSNVTVIVGM